MAEADGIVTTDDAEVYVPRTTFGILAVLWFVFLIELFAAKLPTNSGSDIRVPDLVAFGALNPDLVHLGGEWWRLATAPMLHGGWLHIVLNGIALYFAGRFIELHLGGAVVAGIISVGAIGGTFASLSLGEGALVSVGASGGIMALIAAALLLCYTLPEEADVISGRSLFVRILIPSLVPTHSGVDYAAHFGGAIVGAAIAAVLACCQDSDRYGTMRRYAGFSAAGLFLGVALYGGVVLVSDSPAYDPRARLLRHETYKTMLDYPEERARKLVQDFPGDPQAHLVLSVALYNAGKFDETESEAMTGLRLFRTYGEEPMANSALPLFRVMIALAEAANGYKSRAHSLMSGVCLAFGSAFTDKLVKRQSAQGLCPGS